MKHLFTFIHLCFFLLLGIFGTVFLKYHLIISNFFLILWFAFSLFHILLCLKKIKISFQKDEKKLLYLYIWMVFCIFLSVINFYKIFRIDGIFFDMHFLIKQTMFLNLLPIGISIYLSFLNDYDYIKKTITKISFLILIIFNILVHFNLCNTTGAYFILLLLSFIIIKHKKEKKRLNLFVKLLTFFLTCFYIKYIFSESTAFLMLCIWFIFLIDKRAMEFIQKKKWMFIILALIIIGVVGANINNFLEFLEQKDANYWWRLSYWLNELGILKQTFFMGVGYGSTYASNMIFNTLHGGFIDPATGEFVHSVNVLFTTAQHNSYMNIFYRMGFIGLILFFNYTFSLLFNSKNIIKDNFDKSIYMAFINVNIIIFFNVGLESPQFLLLYFFSSFGLLSLKKLNLKDKNKDENKKLNRIR